MAREYTNKLMEMVSDGCFDVEDLIRNLLSYMSEYDVKDFCISNGYFDEEEE